MAPLTYLRQELSIQGEIPSFLTAYKNLDQKDKDDLKRYATEEMAVRGITVSEK